MPGFGAYRPLGSAPASKISCHQFTFLKVASANKKLEADTWEWARTAGGYGSKLALSRRSHLDRDAPCQSKDTARGGHYDGGGRENILGCRKYLNLNIKDSELFVVEKVLIGRA